MEKVWIGYVPKKDDFDDKIIDEFIDGKTLMGSWAIMTPSNFLLYGAGLGTGLGQRYKKQDNDNWLKVEG